MRRPADGDGTPRARLRAALRAGVMAAAVILGAVAVWMIVTSDTQKGTRVGALIGFWGLLIAAYTVFGTRHQVEMRPHGEPARRDELGMRREDDQLQEMLRREIHAAMSSELLDLRSEVASLRGELVEKVAGQLRMERIETTPVSGSDIEMLQHQVRQLMVAREPADVASFAFGGTQTAPVSGAPERAIIAPLPPAAPDPPAPPLPVTPQQLTPEPAAQLGALQPDANGAPVTSTRTLRPFTDVQLNPIDTPPDEHAYSGPPVPTGDARPSRERPRRH